MTFATAPVLWLAGLAPVVVMLLYLHDTQRRARLTERLGELPVIGRVIASASPGRRAAKAVLAGLGLALVLVAVARPQVDGLRRVKLRGLDVVVAVDVSKSMLVGDVEATSAMAARHEPPSRLGRARELAAALIDALPGDRIGPVVFAGAASHFPLTEDHEVAATFLSDLGPADLPGGSNLAEVFRVSRCLLRPDLYDDLGCSRIGRRGHGGDPLPGEAVDPRDHAKDDGAIVADGERGKAIVVFTDGGDPDEAAAREVATARELGIAVILVGEGSPEGGVVHEIDAAGKATDEVKHGPDGQVVVSRRDDDALKALAAAAGDESRYVIAPPSGEVDPAPIVQALREIDQGEATRKLHEKRDVYEPFLFAGFMLLVIEAAISTRRRREFPEET